MSSALNAETLAAVTCDLVREAYFGADASATWFVNHEPDSGILGTVEPLNAEQASQPGPANGPSVAAHLEHLRWSLATVNETLRGKPWNPDWSASWSVQSVTDKQWSQLKQDLRREVERLLEALTPETFTYLDRMALTGILALAPHAAHHLGTLRQSVRLIQRS